MSDNRDHQKNINRMNPASKHIELGDIIQELITNHNAAMAKLDADVGVTDTNYAATLNITDINDR